MSPGTHTTTVVDYDSSFNPIHQSSVTHNVEAAVDGVHISSPASGETFNMTTVHVVANATESVPISQVQVWDNGHKLGRYYGSGVKQYFNLSPGSHYITVLDLDYHYNILHRAHVTY